MISYYHVPMTLCYSVSIMFPEFWDGAKFVFLVKKLENVIQTSSEVILTVV